MPAAIETLSVELEGGIELICRAAGDPGRPTLIFLHGFPEAAFIWDDWLLHFSSPQHGGYRCVAPNLRGYAGSSAPLDVHSYRPQRLVQDVVELAQALGGGALRALIGHDWGGAIAWNLAILHPRQLERLIIINAPHPAAFVRDLIHSPEQRQASQYMDFLARSDAAQKLAEDDYRRLWALLQGMGPGSKQPGWLDEGMRQRYRQAWSAGLHGPCAYYAATALRPSAQLAVAQQAIAALPTLRVPTQVIWGVGDQALRPQLLEGLDTWVTNLRIERIEEGTHWVVHEQADTVMQLIRPFLDQPLSTPADGPAAGS